jgi:hypothetical protein
MNFSPTELREIADSDLALLAEAMGKLALTKNRVAVDLYTIIARETLRRHESLEIADYSDVELAVAISCLCAAVDASRAAGVSDDYPASRFLLLNLNALLDELERRGLVKELQ